LLFWGDLMVLRILMAGGKSARIGREKPVLKINNIPLVERVYNQCGGCVAVSPNTPETKKLCIERGIDYITTPGQGYVEDTIWLLREYGEFLSISCDIPFVRERDVREIEREFSKDFSLTGYLSLERVPMGGGCNIYNGKCLVGINTVTEGKEVFFQFKNSLLAINVNTEFDLFIADRLARIIDKSDYY